MYACVLNIICLYTSRHPCRSLSPLYWFYIFRISDHISSSPSWGLLPKLFNRKISWGGRGNRRRSAEICDQIGRIETGLGKAAWKSAQRVPRVARCIMFEMNSWNRNMFGVPVWTSSIWFIHSKQKIKWEDDLLSWNRHIFEIWRADLSFWFPKVVEFAGLQQHFHIKLRVWTYQNEGNQGTVCWAQ